MSGFIGILHLDGLPVDPRLLRDLTDFLSFRGPDAREIWQQDSVGFGHALLQITNAATLEKQPAQLDGRLCIVADARIDARAELIGKLRGKSNAARTLSLNSPDAELILHAYDAWGDACVDHLIGDFAFAIWDARKRRLFCARDQFGVKPFYYAQIGSSLIFSNTLNCIRKHPAVSSRLNDLAIADFLLFEMNQDPFTTTFADIQRLPPAHVLVCEQGTVSKRRYWELCVTTPVQFARDQEYIERFRGLLDAAVADRLRSNTAGVLMSGGLDSTTIAASAQRNFEREARPSGLSAHTVVLDKLIPFEERHFATITASHLGIPIEFFVGDQLKIFEYAERPEYCPPEPTHTAWPDTTLDQLRQVSAGGRVALTGYGADPAFCGRLTVHFRQLLKEQQLGRALADALRYLNVEGRLSRLYLRTRWRILFASKSDGQGYPEWLNEDLEKRLELRERWESKQGNAPPSFGVRPEAQEAMVSSLWPNMFEYFDAGSIRVPVEVYHPFFDLRLVSFLIALPRLPWCSDKELLREAARGVLPDRVRLRRKSPLIADPLIALLRQPEAAWVDSFKQTRELDGYVRCDRIPAVSREKKSSAAWIGLRPLSLNFWLRRSTL